MTTWCKECDHVHAETRKQEPWKWRCVRVPVAPGYGFVDPQHSPSPPYARCSDVNRSGDCQYFVALRHPEPVGAK